MAHRVDQRGACAQTGSIVAGDQINNTTVLSVSAGARLPGIVEQLLAKLQAEIAKNAQVRDTVESLKFFYEHRKSVDGIVGLEHKLRAGDRLNELYNAYEKKEQFVKLLEKWSLYASAQEIFAYLLAGAEHHFSFLIHPKIEDLSEVEVNHLVDTLIVNPTITECGTSVFTLNHGLVMGMLYWLAEQCFIRWHK